MEKWKAKKRFPLSHRPGGCYGMSFLFGKSFGERREDSLRG
jgi:hypothetical protein